MRHRFLACFVGLSSRAFRPPIPHIARCCDFMAEIWLMSVPCEWLDTAAPPCRARWFACKNSARAFCKTWPQVTDSYRLELWREVRHPSNQCPQTIWGQPILPTNNTKPFDNIEARRFVIVAKHKKQFLSLCRTQISLEMTTPTSEGCRGDGGPRSGPGSR
jgi:hypothetical protein